MKKSLLLMTIVALSQTAFSATLDSLTKEQVTNTFVNKTVVSIATDVFNGHVTPATFSFYLDDKGNIIGKFSTKPNNGPQIDTGVYAIDKDGAMYATWKHWYDGKKVCFHFFNTQNAYLSVDCNNVFHTAYLKNDIKEGNQLGENINQ